MIARSLKGSPGWSSGVAKIWQETHSLAIWETSQILKLPQQPENAGNLEHEKAPERALQILHLKAAQISDRPKQTRSSLPKTENKTRQTSLIKLYLAAYHREEKGEAGSNQYSSKGTNRNPSLITMCRINLDLLSIWSAHRIQEKRE